MTAIAVLATNKRFNEYISQMPLILGCLIASAVCYTYLSRKAFGFKQSHYLLAAASLSQTYSLMGLASFKPEVIAPIVLCGAGSPMLLAWKYLDKTIIPNLVDKEDYITAVAEIHFQLVVIIVKTVT